MNGLSVQELEEEELNRQIIECYPVRRPLNIPSIIKNYGKVLSHSAILACSQEDDGTYLIDYMDDDYVHVRKVKNCKKGEEFVFENLKYIYDDRKPQRPNKNVSLKRLATLMMKYMKNEKFSTWSHNCHEARYMVMKRYGMESEDPYQNDINIFFQGFVDYFANLKQKWSL